nr:NADH dehydrogenase subunit 6 [Chaetocnema pelagica]
MMFIIMNSLLLVMVKHPLTCGLILLLQTFFTSMITGMMNLNYWYSYILFLIMIGGMLILFIYMTSIASNEKFKFNMKILALMLILMIPLTILFFIDPFYTLMMTENSHFQYQNLSYHHSFKKYMNWPNNFLMLMMMIYLFITLIMVVKITKFSYGPLRQKM